MTETILNERDFEICPNCNRDLTQGSLMYVQIGCENTIFYKKFEKLGWMIDDQVEGDGEDGYYACRECDNKLPDSYQEYYSNNL